MTPKPVRKPSAPTSGEPCCDQHHDRFYIPAGAVSRPDNWVCSHGDHPVSGWHFRNDSCPPAPPLSEAPSQRVISHELET